MSKPTRLGAANIPRAFVKVRCLLTAMSPRQRRHVCLETGLHDPDRPPVSRAGVRLEGSQSIMGQADVARAIRTVRAYLRGMSPRQREQFIEQMGDHFALAEGISRDERPHTFIASTAKNCVRARQAFL